MLWDIDELALFWIALGAFATVMELAFRLGRRQSTRSDDVTRSHVGALEGALLGLLALLLGFNFAMAVARFDARKTLIQEEVSAINATYLRAQLLPAQHQREVTRLLREYVAARIDFMSARIDKALIEKAVVSAAQVEENLWTVAGAVAAQNLAPVPTGMFIQSVNDLININDKRRAALDDHVPQTVLWLLLTVALTALGFVAYNHGLAGRRRDGATVIYALLIGMVLTVIIDLDRPSTGLIRVSEDGMVQLKQTMDRRAK